MASVTDETTMKTLRIGLIIPWMNTTLEDELSTAFPPHVGLHWARIAPTQWPADSHDESYLAGMYDDIHRARASFTGIQLNAIIIGCTSLSFSRKTSDALFNCARRERWVTVQDTIMASWHRKHLNSTYLFGPYGKDVLDQGASELERSGIPLADCYRIPYTKEIKDITTEQVVDYIINQNLPHSACVIVSCTALYSLRIPNLLELSGRSDLTVISSNGSIYDYITSIGKNAEIIQCE